MRRFDRFTPLDLNLAQHRITVEGRIRAELVDRFLTSPQSQKLKIDDRRVFPGEEITLFVPAIRLPKRTLLEFSARDGDDASLSVLQRYEGAQVAAGYVLSLLEAGRTQHEHHWMPGDHEGGIDDLVDLRRIVTALMFLNPRDVLERLTAWAKRRPTEGPDDRLRAWVADEGDLYLKGSGDRLAAALDQAIISATGGQAVPIPDWARVKELRYFRTLTTLLLYGIRDVLKIVVDDTDPFQSDPPGTPGFLEGSSPRERLVLGGADKFAEDIRAGFVSGLRDLHTLLGAQATLFAENEFFRSLAVWTAYVPMTIQLDVPFVLSFAQTEQLESPPNWRPAWQSLEQRIARFFKTSQEYPLAGVLKDASAVHIEITVPDEELRLGKPLWWHRLWTSCTTSFSERAPNWVRQVLRGVRVRPQDSEKQHSIPRDRIVLLSRLPDGKVQAADLDRFFGVIERPSERLLHIYSSRQALEARHEDDLYRFLIILVPLRLSVTTFYAYLFAAFAFLAAAIYVGATFGSASWSGKTPGDLDPLVTAAALAATLTLWLVTVHHPRPIINAKVSPARVAFFVALLVTVGAPLVFVLAQILRWAF